MSVRWETVAAKAREVRERHHIETSAANLFEIASSEGIDILYFTPDDETNEISGLLDKAIKRVYLNVSETAARQNFTLAHELAHYFLDHKPDEYGVYRRDSLYTDQKPEKEQEADYFAAELLMPEELVAKTKKTYDLTDDNAAALSRLFGVSHSAMKYRLKELGRERQS